MPASASRSCGTRTMSWAKPMGLGVPVWRAASPMSLMSTVSLPTSFLGSTRVRIGPPRLGTINLRVASPSDLPPLRGQKHNDTTNRCLVAHWHRRQIAPGRCGGVGFLKVFVGKAVEMGASHKNLCGDVAWDRTQQVTRHIGEVGV